MSHLSDISQQIVERTSLREIDSFHYAGRHNNFFISINIQGRLSRLTSSISVYNISGNEINSLEKHISNTYGLDFSTVLFENNEITLFTPIKKKTIPLFIDFVNDVTEYLVELGAKTDPLISTEPINIPSTATETVVNEKQRNYTGWGFLGSFLGSIPGVMAWFIITILQHNARFLQSPDFAHIVSLGWIMAVIITCGSYWGFLLLSEGFRTRSFFLSLPFTIFMILAVNCFSQAFLFYSTIPGITFLEAFSQTPNLVFQYNLALYYFGSLVLAFLLSAITYFFIFRFREKGWQRGD